MLKAMLLESSSMIINLSTMGVDVGSKCYF